MHCLKVTHVSRDIAPVGLTWCLPALSNWNTSGHASVAVAVILDNLCNPYMYHDNWRFVFSWHLVISGIYWMVTGWTESES